VTLGGASILYSGVSKPPSGRDIHQSQALSHTEVSPESISPEGARLFFRHADITMASESLPGRPDNLTPDEEAKLKEMWLATLQVFGVFKSESDAIDPALVQQSAALSPVPAVTRTDTESSAGDRKKKDKKEKRGLFRRKKQDESNSTADVGTVSSLSAADGDDKYGQIKGFKAVLASQTPDELRAAFWSMSKHDHPDGLLLRFLRARKWDVEKALIMMVSTMHWRDKEMHVDSDVVLRGESGAVSDLTSNDSSVKKEGEDFLAQLRLGKSFLHGIDKENRPICVIRVRLHKAGEQTEQSLERFTVYTIETARLFLASPIDTAVSADYHGKAALANSSLRHSCLT
jgi:CRAL/TRIO, N-terminal domain/CRAL/TRIO domain